MKDANWKWLKKHDIVLKELACMGLSARSMTVRFNRRFDTQKTQNAVTTHCWNVGISIGGLDSSTKRSSSVSRIRKPSTISFGFDKPAAERKPPQFKFAPPTVNVQKTGVALAEAVNLILADHPQTRALDLRDMHPHHCRWSTSELDASNHHFCGHSIVPGRLYCPHHSLRAQDLASVKNKALREIINAYENGERSHEIIRTACSGDRSRKAA